VNRLVQNLLEIDAPGVGRAAAPQEWHRSRRYRRRARPFGRTRDRRVRYPGPADLPLVPIDDVSSSRCGQFSTRREYTPAQPHSASCTSTGEAITVEVGAQVGLPRGEEDKVFENVLSRDARRPWRRTRPRDLPGNHQGARGILAQNLPRVVASVTCPSPAARPGSRRCLTRVVPSRTSPDPEVPARDARRVMAPAFERLGRRRPWVEVGRASRRRFVDLGCPHGTPRRHPARARVDPTCRHRAVGARGERDKVRRSKPARTTTQQAFARRLLARIRVAPAATPPGVARADDACSVDDARSISCAARCSSATGKIH